MIGISWGGFNGLQVAARRPPALKAIVTLLRDRRPLRRRRPLHRRLRARRRHAPVGGDDAHLQRAAAGPGGRSATAGARCGCERLDGRRPLVEDWLAHQRRDGTGSRARCARTTARSRRPCTPSAAGRTATRTPSRGCSRASPGPCKGLIGPWAHTLPAGRRCRGPAIGFLQECVRWLDHWLKGVDNGVMDEPKLRAWMQDAVPPAGHYAERPGRWVAEPAWPPPSVDGRRSSRWTALAADARPQPASRAGQLDAGAWCPDGGQGDWPTDQRAEDGRSLSFTLPPLEADVEILGFPDVELSPRSRPAERARRGPSLRRRARGRRPCSSPAASSTSPTATRTSTSRAARAGRAATT